MQDQLKRMAQNLLWEKEKEKESHTTKLNRQKNPENHNPDPPQASLFQSQHQTSSKICLDKGRVKQ